MIKVTLENIGGAVVVLPDGDFFRQTGELADFLMHVGILMPNCTLPDTFYIVSEEELKLGGNPATGGSV